MTDTSHEAPSSSHDLLIIENAGADIARTNYWDSAMAREGYLFASWNAGTLRLLVPDVQLHVVTDMKTGAVAVVSRGHQVGRDVIRILFDDGTDAPLVAVMSVEQCDRAIEDGAVGRTLKVIAWGREGKLGQWPGLYGPPMAG